MLMYFGKISLSMAGSSCSLVHLKNFIIKCRISIFAVLRKNERKRLKFNGNACINVVLTYTCASGNKNSKRCILAFVVFCDESLHL
jgi:hypothetical protein